MFYEIQVLSRKHRRRGLNATDKQIVAYIMDIYAAVCAEL